MQVLKLPICLAGVLLLAACSNELPVSEQPVLVRTFTVGEPLISGREAVAADTLARNRTSDSQAFSEVAGEVLEILVTNGERVNAGQALLRIDPRDIRLADSSAKVQMQAARAELAAAEADFSRYTELKDKRFISQAEWERRRASLEVSRARFEATLDQLGVSSIRALHAASVVSVSIRAGEQVQAGQLLVRLSPDQPKSVAKPRVGADQRRREVLIPLTAIVDGQAVMKLVAVDGGRYQVQRQAVRLGAVRDREVQILEGLAPGDRIVAIGAHLLTSGQAVRLTQNQER
jgi:multidrug efflux pump subunit AcrA (membrane-fusion protein)